MDAEEDGTGRVEEGMREVRAPRGRMSLNRWEEVGESFPTLKWSGGSVNKPYQTNLAQRVERTVARMEVHGTTPSLPASVEGIQYTVMMHLSPTAITCASSLKALR